MKYSLSNLIAFMTFGGVWAWFYVRIQASNGNYTWVDCLMGSGGIMCHISIVAYFVWHCIIPVSGGGSPRDEVD